MIYTLTLNPAIDYYLHTDRLNIGGIQKSFSEELFFGGKGINVSLVLDELGVRSVATGFVAGFTGAALEKSIENNNITADFVHLSGGLTRINVKIRAEEETDINAAGPAVSEQDIESLFSKLGQIGEGDILVLAGSVPKQIPDDIYQRIMEKLNGRGVKFVLDAERELLLNGLKYKPFLIKPNEQELGEIFGEKIESAERALYYANRLKEMGALNVLVSRGGEGSVLIDEKGREYIIPAKKGNVINTVGAGDSTVAGFIAGYLKTGDYEYALRLGTACGSATAFSEGLATREKIKEIF